MGEEDGRPQTAGREAPSPNRINVERDKLAVWKEGLSIAQSVAAIIAILTAGLWFFLRGEAFERANITHEVTHRQIHPDWTWIHVTVDVENVGKRPIKLRSGFAWVQKILPLESSLADLIERNKPLIPNGQLGVAWRQLDRSRELGVNRQIAPGENDSLRLEFVVPSSVKTVRIYTGFMKEAKSMKGWDRVTIYDLTPVGGIVYEP